ncbi:MAG: gliding motility-associated ABC transporter permease subunit GldF, partial [Leeuwenhoekiella sp.]
LFLWIFPGDFNILDYGYADLTPFFQLVPWIFLFLIPAITMRSFSEEIRLGTLELLLTKPISVFGIVFGKFFGAFILIIIALIPTLFYVYAIDKLGYPPGNFDYGILIGSYLGLLFLAAAYTAIGIFASSFSENQIVAFIIAVFICFLLYFGLKQLADYNLFGTADYYLDNLSMQSHFDSISRGVIDTRDLTYFITLTGFFLYMTKLRLNLKK